MKKLSTILLTVLLTGSAFTRTQGSPRVVNPSTLRALAVAGATSLGCFAAKKLLREGHPIVAKGVALACFLLAAQTVSDIVQ